MDAGGVEGVVDIAGDALEDQIAIVVGGKMDVAIAVKSRELHGEVVDGFLVGDDAVVILFDLAFIERRGFGEGDTGQRKLLGEVGRVGDFEFGIRTVEEERQAAGVIDVIGEVGEHPRLVGVVVEDVASGGGAFDAEGVVFVGAGHEVVQFSPRAAELEGGIEGVVASAVEGQFVVGQGLSGFCGDIDDSGGVKAELSGKAAVDEGDVIDEAGVELLAEAVEGLGEDNAIDAIGEVGVLAADVFLAKGIFDDAGHAEEDLLEGRIFTSGRGLYLGGTDGVGGSARPGAIWSRERLRLDLTMTGEARGGRLSRGLGRGTRGWLDGGIGGSRGCEGQRGGGQSADAGAHGSSCVGRFMICAG